jgi:hypothetical protein
MNPNRHGTAESHATVVTKHP